MIANDTVTWDRQTTGATDARGHPTRTSAAGFPKTGVKGSWQPRSASTKSTPEGAGGKIVVVFISPVYFDGQHGDYVTGPDGVRYLVEEALDRSKGTNLSLRHVRYGLSKAI